MGNRLSEIVTRTGDQGTTGMADGSRLNKTDLRVQALGEVDELNACIGVALSSLEEGSIRQLLFEIQHDLFDIGAELCQPGKTLIDEGYVDYLETQVETYNNDLPRLKDFILPGGSAAVAGLQLARAVCRRVERCLISMNESHAVNMCTRQYLNRLSDLLFIMARSQARVANENEIYWNSKYSRAGRASQ